MPGISGIYQIQSKIKPERIYVGSAIDIQKRWKDHLYRLRINRHINNRLQNHYNKYGKNDLTFSILIGCAKEDLVVTEQFYIDSKKCWFNLCPKAGNTFGLKQTDKAKQNNRLAKLGIKHTDEHNAKIAKAQSGENNSFFNKHHSEESKQKKREWNLIHGLRPPTYHGGRSKGAKNKPKLETVNLN